MENLRGAALMTLSMLAFAIEDVLIKTLGARIPSGQIVSIIGAGAALAFVLWFLVNRQPVFVPAHLNRRVWLRGLFDVMGTMLFITALMLLDVTMLSAIIQATPLVVAFGGVIFLGQSVGWRRWAAILVGFVGVLIIIRPGVDGVSWPILLGVGGMLGLAARDLATRAITVEISGAHVSLHAFLLLVPTGFFLCWINGQPMVAMSAQDSFTLVGCITFALLGYLTIVAATRSGDAAFISMFRYTRMVFALVLGMVFLGERPDTLMLIGVTIVIAAGLFTFLREARLRHASHSAVDPI